MKQKLKICIGCNLPKPIFSKGRCTDCDKRFSFLNRKNTPKKGKKPLKRSRINFESAKRKADNIEYRKLSKKFLQENPNCARCGRPASEVHHMASRGKRLLWRNFFLSVCSEDHRWITDNSKEAIEQGYTIARKDWPKTEEG